MEKVLQIKMQKVVDEVNKKEEELKQKINTFKESFFTDDIKEMIDHIITHLDMQEHEDSWQAYSFESSEGYRIEIRWTDIRINNVRFGISRNNNLKNTRILCDDKGIQTLQEHKDNIIQQSKMLQVLQGNLMQMLNDITNQYLSIIDAQTSELDAIMRELDFEDDTHTSFKITVEWR